MTRLTLILVFLLAYLGGDTSSNQAAAAPPPQADCGFVDALDYPLPLDRFWIRYGFGMPSRRFLGRLHAGEDWYAREGPTLGQPVYAIARGKVTLSSPTVWGTDKGMIVIEHTMPDRSIWYSVYGHLDTLNEHNFPREGTCVALGDIVGAIGDAAPGPHLHFEIRDRWPHETGPGYWPVDPTLDGWANPTQFITNWQVWLRGAHRWRFDLRPPIQATIPGMMDGEGNLYFINHGGSLFVVSATGQYIWYSGLNAERPLGIVRTGPETFTIGFADGQMQDWPNYGGTPQVWDAGAALDGPPIAFGDLLVVHTVDQQLRAYDANRALVWELAGVGRVMRSATTGGVLAITDNAGRFWLVGAGGQIIDHSTFGAPGDVTPAPDGSVYLRAEAELWQVSPQGARRWLAETPPVQPMQGRLLADPDDGLYLWTGGELATLVAYDGAGAVRWEQRLPDSVGTVVMAIDPVCPGRLILAGGRGYVAIFDTADGTRLTEMRFYSARNHTPFIGLAGDGRLRLMIYDRLAAFDLDMLAGACQ